MALGKPGGTTPTVPMEPLKDCLLMAAIYLLAGAFSLQLLGRETGPHPVWPAAGIALGMLLTNQPGRREGIVLGSLGLNLPLLLAEGLSLPAGLLASAALGLGACLQAQWGAQLVRHQLGPRPPLQQSAKILRFLLLAGPVACLVSATTGVVVLHWAGVLASAEVSRAWMSWWAGDCIGVIVFAPLTLMVLPSQRDLWQGRRKIVVVPSLLVLALSVWGFNHAIAMDEREAQLRLNRRADLAVETLLRTITAHEEALYGLQSLILSVDDPTPEAFASFTAGHLHRLRGLHALSWNPVVEEQELRAFEALQRQRPDRAGFRVTERNRAGALVPVRPHQTMVPVTLIEPLAANQSALGFDIGSDPVRAATIRAALASGRPTATAPIQLVQERGNQKGVLMILPIEEPRGFAVGVYRLGDLLEDCFAEPGWQGIQVRLLESLPDQGTRELGQVGRVSGSAERSRGQERAAILRPIQVGGQQWLLEVRWHPQAMTTLRNPGLALIPVAGLLICAPLEGFLLLTSGSEQLRQQDLQRKLRISLRAAAKAHEIKQPLARLLLQASAIRRLLHRTEPVSGRGDDLIELAEGIMRDAREMSEAVNAIRDLLRSTDQSLAALNLSHTVQTALLRFKAALEHHNIELASGGLDQPHRIAGERGQLHVMLNNLLQNAMAAAGPGGHIAVALRATPFGIELAVGDDGPGFPRSVEKLQDLLLTSETPEGTGIGLFLVGCAVENHHASIQLGQSPLGGACITIVFPPLACMGHHLRQG